MYFFDINAGNTLDFKFNMVNTSSVPTTLAGSPVISIYKDNDTTQSTSGVTLTVDFDGITGLNHVRIDTSASASFYSFGSSFQAVITTGTVGGVSVVGYVVLHFGVNNRIALGTGTGACASSATTTNIPTSGLYPAVTVANQLKGRIIIFNYNTTTAALRGQATDITANTSGGVLTVSALTNAPANGDTFIIV